VAAERAKARARRKSLECRGKPAIRYESATVNQSRIMPDDALTQQKPFTRVAFRQQCRAATTREAAL
jgi:hypothetical protein